MVYSFKKYKEKGALPTKILPAVLPPFKRTLSVPVLNFGISVRKVPEQCSCSVDPRLFREKGLLLNLNTTVFDSIHDIILNLFSLVVTTI